MWLVENLFNYNKYDILSFFITISSSCWYFFISSSICLRYQSPSIIYLFFANWIPWLLRNYNNRDNKTNNYNKFGRFHNDNLIMGLVKNLFN